jgi:hypothetical protein
MRKLSLSAPLVLALAVGPAGAQAVLAPATDTPPGGQAEPPVRFARSLANAPAEPPPPFEPAVAVGGPLPKAWERMEYLLWWIRDTRLPPLITANKSGNVAILTEPGTTVVAGNSHLDNKDRSGGRFTLGAALDDAQTLGLEANYFFLGSRTTTVGSGSSGAAGTPAIAVPYHDVTTNTEQVQTVAFPGFARGSATVSASARMQGAEVNALANLWYESWFQLDGLLGFRYLELDEGLQLAYASDRLSNPGGVTPVRLGAADQFDGHNRFYGGQVGLRTEFRWGLFFLNLAGKVALGDTYEVVRIGGVSAQALPGRSAVLTRGGTLALPSNIGRFARDQFAVLPEANVQVGVLLRPDTRLFLGYNLIYLSDVARPADQIDRTANPTQMPLSTRGGPFFGPARPAFAFHGTDFWAQGLVSGVEYRY